MISIFVGVVIIFLAFISSSQYDLGIITTGGIIHLISIETLYRIIFNPLWAIALWAFSYGRQLNSERHQEILQNIQGALDSCEYDDIKTSKIYEMIYKHDSVEKRMEKKFKEEDTVNERSDNKNPII